MTLAPSIARAVAQTTSRGPHPNPPLAKGRGPEMQLIVGQITIKEGNFWQSFINLPLQIDGNLGPSQPLESGVNPLSSLDFFYLVRIANGKTQGRQ
ncbi:hypothetical protein [Oscillatoria sp. HE19RPO]|uniref:hypothetical protein n=1 Tax=Oscillatoria sp. HE19RPO TaxID=2954806 RepID=UPI0020C3F160|nr:hypothetical protein [Oscillatoria sp. HE19RPO]